MPYKYATKDGENEKTARAVSLNLSISTKHSIEICSDIRGKYLDKAKKMLGETIIKKRAVPFKRFNRDMGHKRGIAAGRFPIKACTEILSLLNSVEANATEKGLSAEDLIIKAIVPHKAATPSSSGRRRGREAKRTHIEVVVEEIVSKKRTKKTPAKKETKVVSEKKVAVKPKVETPVKEAKPEEPKAEVKPVEEAVSEKPKVETPVKEVKPVEEKKEAEKPAVKESIKEKKTEAPLKEVDKK